MGKHHLTHMFSLKFVSKKSAVTAGVQEKLNQRTELRRRVWRMIVSLTIKCVVLRPLEMNHRHSLDYIGKNCFC